MERFTSKRTCNKKQKYNSENEANKALKCQTFARNKIQSTLRPYKCNVCNKWHLGHKFSPRDLDSIFKELHSAEEIL